jgi:hypothetical protein
MKILLMLVVVEFLTLVVFAWFNRVAWIRILALRQQLIVYKRKSKKPKLRNGRILKPRQGWDKRWTLPERSGSTGFRGYFGFLRTTGD